MTPKEYLNQYKSLTWELERISREIESINEAIDSIAITFDGMPKGHNRISRRPEDFAVKLSVLKNKKAQKWKQAWEKREEIITTIANVKEPLLSKLLYDRYIDLMNWEDIAEDIACSEYWARTTMHGNALKAVEKIINKKI